MKKKTILLLSLLPIAAVATVLYVKAGKKPETVSFTTANPQYGFIGKSVTATGAVEPVDTVSVGAQVSDVVTKVYADFNSVVKKGRLLAQVDASIFSAQEEASKATVSNARSNL